MLVWLVLLQALRVSADVALFNPILPRYVQINIDKGDQGDKIDQSYPSIDVKWTESNASPKLSEIHNYTFVLCNGLNLEINPVATLAKDWVSPLTHTNLPLDSISEGVYFIQVVAKGADFITIHYTDRFMVYLEEQKGFEVKGPDPLTKYFGATTTSSARVRYAPAQPTVGQTITKRWVHNIHSKGSKAPKSPGSGVFTGPGWAHGKKITPKYDYTITTPPSTTNTMGPNTLLGLTARELAYDPVVRVKPPTRRPTSSNISV